MTPNREPARRPEIILTVDIVLFTLAAERLQVVLTRRERGPFTGQLALPGGYLHADEDADSRVAARRVLAAKCGLHTPYLEQLYTFSGGARDPRGWSVSIAHYALVPLTALRDQASASFVLLPADELPQLPFDHNRIVDLALDRLRNKSTYSSLPCFLLPPLFTLTELQQTYEQVLGHKLDKSTFRRKLSELDFLEASEEQRTGTHRPAQLWRIRMEKQLALFDRTI